MPAHIATRGVSLLSAAIRGLKRQSMRSQSNFRRIFWTERKQGSGNRRREFFF